MGCIWSSSEADQCRHCSRRAVNNLIVINHQCEVCIQRANRPKANVQPRNVSASCLQLKPRFGEYKCVCGHQWNSRLSWADRYQLCKRCRKQVYAFSQRELRPGDMSQDKENVQEHQRDLCQMCNDIGHYCGDMRKQKTIAK